MFDSQFWSGRRVLITGHTGFKGSWLSLWLTHLGAKVHGVALAPDTSPSLADQIDVYSLDSRRILDICKVQSLKEIVDLCNQKLYFILQLVLCVAVIRSAGYLVYKRAGLSTLEALKPLNHRCVVVMITRQGLFQPGGLWLSRGRSLGGMILQCQQRQSWRLQVEI